MKICFFKYLTIFLTGGMVYYFMEIFTRNYSHYSMIICGGFCTVLCGAINQIKRDIGIIWQMIISSIIITLLEFITGYIVNIKLKIGVWDYSYLPLNIMGQVCLIYSMLWMVLSVVIIFVDDGIRHFLYNEELPLYKII